MKPSSCPAARPAAFPDARKRSKRRGRSAHPAAMADTARTPRARAKLRGSSGYARRRPPSTSTPRRGCGAHATSRVRSNSTPHASACAGATPDRTGAPRTPRARASPRRAPTPRAPRTRRPRAPAAPRPRGRRSLRPRRAPSASPRRHNFIAARRASLARLVRRLPVEQRQQRHELARAPLNPHLIDCAALLDSRSIASTRRAFARGSIASTSTPSAASHPSPANSARGTVIRCAFPATTDSITRASRRSSTTRSGTGHSTSRRDGTIAPPGVAVPPRDAARVREPRACAIHPSRREARVVPRLAHRSTRTQSRSRSFAQWA